MSTRLSVAAIAATAAAAGFAITGTGPSLAQAHAAAPPAGRLVAAVDPGADTTLDDLEATIAQAGNEARSRMDSANSALQAEIDDAQDAAMARLNAAVDRLNAAATDVQHDVRHSLSEVGDQPATAPPPLP